MAVKRHRGHSNSFIKERISISLLFCRSETQINQLHLGHHFLLSIMLLLYYLLFSSLWPNTWWKLLQGGGAYFGLQFTVTIEGSQGRNSNSEPYKQKVKCRELFAYRPIWLLACSWQALFSLTLFRNPCLGELYSSPWTESSYNK